MVPAKYCGGVFRAVPTCFSSVWSVQFGDEDASFIPSTAAPAPNIAAVPNIAASLEVMCIGAAVEILLDLDLDSTAVLVVYARAVQLYRYQAEPRAGTGISLLE